MKTIRVDISCWKGYSVGASHYYVRIKDDSGATLHRSKFDTYEAAKAYVNEKLAAYPPDEYEYESTGETAIRFVYGRVGD